MKDITFFANLRGNKYLMRCIHTDITDRKNKQTNKQIAFLSIITIKVSFLSEHSRISLTLIRTHHWVQLMKCSTPML